MLKAPLKNNDGYTNYSYNLVLSRKSFGIFVATDFMPVLVPFLASENIPYKVWRWEAAINSQNTKLNCLERS